MAHKTVGRTITRIVLGEGLVKYQFENGISPGVAKTLADMFKWNKEVANGYHRKIHPNGWVDLPEPYSNQDFDRVLSLCPVFGY